MNCVGKTANTGTCSRTHMRHSTSTNAARQQLHAQRLERGQRRIDRRTRLHAIPSAELAELQYVGEGLGVVGIGAGGLFAALWNLEKQAGGRLQQELQAVQEQAQALQQQVVQLQQQLEAEEKARKEAEEWKPRLDAAQTELFKLERALELKDGQLATFMNTAHRQIKSLEETVKELQKM